MMSPANDTPELTAYAMGELDAHQAGDIHSLLADCPAALSELEQIEAMTDALRQSAPIPQDRLLPEQRHAVLRPTHLPRRITPLLPRPLPATKRPSMLWPVVANVLKAAAVVTVTSFAYLAGRHATVDLTETAHLPESGGATATAAEPTPVEATPPAAATARPAATRQESLVSALSPTTHDLGPVPPAVTIAVPAASVSQAPVAVTVAAAAAAKPAPKAAVAPDQAPEAAAAVAVVAAAPAPKAPTPVWLAGTTLPGRDRDFVSTLKQPVSAFDLRPSNIRPAPAKNAKGELFASPAPAPKAAAGDTARETPKARTPEVYIHAWKAEVASCPWNEGHRLMRVTVQLPADQPAALGASAYPLKVNFDPSTVREYRQLCERHQPAAELRSAGTHVVWYEFQPNGDGTQRDNARTVATVTLENGRFTTQPVGPFDSSKMSVQDRGQTWQSAREDFVFDSSVVGFGLLLRGTPNAPQLNHDLVLALAQKGKGADATGERARFIRLITDARKAAGL